MAKDTEKTPKLAKTANADKAPKLAKPVTAHIPVRGAKGVVMLVEVKAQETGVSRRGNKVFKVTPTKGVGELTMTEAQIQFAV